MSLDPLDSCACMFNDYFTHIPTITQRDNTLDVKSPVLQVLVPLP